MEVLIRPMVNVKMMFVFEPDRDDLIQTFINSLVLASLWSSELNVNNMLTMIMLL